MQYRFASLACRASIVWQRFFLMFWDVELPLRYIDDSTVVVGLKAGFLEFPLKALDLFLKPLCAFGGWRCCILLEPAFRDTNAGYALPFVCLVSQRLSVFWRKVTNPVENRRQAHACFLRLSHGT